MTINSPPLQSVPDTVEKIFRDIVGVQPPPADVDLIDSGLLDSLMLIMLLAELEAAFSITIALEVLEPEEIRTLARLVALVERQRSTGAQIAAAPDGLIVRLRDGTGGPPVFLVPGVGGAPLGLRPLVHALDIDCPVYGLAPLEYENRLASLRVEDMAAAYAEAIRSTAPAGPCVLGGVCFGGLVAFETARRLRAAAYPVDQVVLFNTRPAVHSLGWRAYMWFRCTQPYRLFRYVLPDWRTRIPDAIRRGLVRIPAFLRSRGRSGNPKPAGTSGWATIADRAAQVYRPCRYDDAVTMFVTAERVLSTFDPEEVWSRCVYGELRVERIEGRHGDFLRGPHLVPLAAQFSRLLRSP